IIMSSIETCLEGEAIVGDCAAFAHTSDECVHVLAGVFPDLRTGGLVVDLGVSLIRELTSKNCVVLLRQNLISLVDSTLHASSTWGQDDFRTVCAQQDAALSGHGLWHGQYNLVATGCANKCQCDTGVA